MSGEGSGMELDQEGGLAGLWSRLMGLTDGCQGWRLLLRFECWRILVAEGRCKKRFEFQLSAKH